MRSTSRTRSIGSPPLSSGRPIRFRGKPGAFNSSQPSAWVARHNFAMGFKAIRLVFALLALTILAAAPDSALLAQGRGGAGGGAQGGAFGQGGQGGQGGGGRAGGQLPPRDPNAAPGANGDQAAGTAVIRGRVVSADAGTPVRRVQVRAQAGEIRANRLVSTDAQGRFEFKDLP